MIFLKRRALMTRASFNYKTVSGIGSAFLENCVETKFKRFSLFGNSAQGENPSIESPKEIKNSGKYDEVSGKYVIDVSVTGKNLFDINSFPYKQDDETIVINSNEANGGALLVKGDTLRRKQYVISIESFENIGDNTSTVLLETVYKDGVKDERYLTAIPKTGWVLSSTREIDYIWIRNPWKAGSKIKKLQIEEGKEATEYEPYHEPQTIQLQLDEPLRGIGEYKDVITKDGILRKIGHLEIKGGLIWNDWGNQFRIIVYVEKGVIIYSKYLCNYTNDVKNFGNQNYVYLYFTRKQVEAIGINTNDTLEVANKKLNEIVANKPIVIEYPLKTPIFVPFPQETKLALENLHANDGTTIITVDSGEVETGIEVEYAVKE